MAACWLTIHRLINLIPCKGVRVIFMRNRFWNGLFAGSVLGAMVAWFFSPQRKPGTSRRVMGSSRKMQSRARKIMRRVRDGVTDLME